MFGIFSKKEELGLEKEVKEVDPNAIEIKGKYDKEDIDAPKIKYFLTADFSVVEPQTGKLNVNGIFDTVRSIIFPSMIPEFYITLGFNNIKDNLDVIMQVLRPDGMKHFATELNVKSNSYMDTVNKIAHIKSMTIPMIGEYTVNIINKENMKIIDSFTFNAAYPPKRIFTEQEIIGILNDPNCTKNGRIELKCAKCGKVHKVELNLNPNAEIEEGWEKYPEGDSIKCDCGDRIELIGVKRQIEWTFGNKIN